MTTFVSPLKWPEGWPRTPRDKLVWGSFARDLSIYRATTSLTEELRRASAVNVVITTNLRLTKMGNPFNDQKQPDDVGVAIYFAIGKRELTMARDGFNRVEKNIRSLALAIEHMRGLERHGGSHMMERAFAGFAALPAPDRAAPEFVDWKEVLGPIPEGLATEDLLAIVEARYRNKSRDAHPDRDTDGSEMIRLNIAIKLAREELKK